MPIESKWAAYIKEHTDDNLDNASKAWVIQLLRYMETQRLPFGVLTCPNLAWVVEADHKKK
jgi:hypothetical protein